MSLFYLIHDWLFLVWQFFIGENFVLSSIVLHVIEQPQQKSFSYLNFISLI